MLKPFREAFSASIQNLSISNEKYFPSIDLVVVPFQPLLTCIVENTEYTVKLNNAIKDASLQSFREL